jgi:hypothetical protein
LGTGRRYWNGRRRPVPDLREQAGKIKKNVLAVCLDPGKKVNKEQTATIMRYFKNMSKIVEDLLLHNSYLTGTEHRRKAEGNPDSNCRKPDAANQRAARDCGKENREDGTKEALLRGKSKNDV